MDEEKKSEASSEDAERLEPYLIEEQVEQSHDSPVEVYLATHETSGDKALVRKHPAKEKAAQRPEWQVLIGYWASRGYSFLHLKHTGWARALDKQSAESLLFTLESVLEEVRLMAGVLAVTPEPRPRWHLGLGLGVVSAATVGALLFALVRLDPVPQPPSTPPAPISHEELWETELPDSIDMRLMDTIAMEPFSFARPLPKAPYKGQKRPPCNPHIEVELIGACWSAHEIKAPCPDSLHEHQGKCYVPSFSAKPPPSALGQ
jgi:hypothetical protein